MAPATTEATMARGDEEELVTRREAADIADVHVNTIRLWESTGRVHAMKREDGVVMIPRSEIDAIIAHRQAPKSDAERVAALEAENRELRRELDSLTERYERLLNEIVSLAKGQG